MENNIAKIIEYVEKPFLNEESKSWKFNIGDTIQVHYKIKDSKRDQIQIFEGIVIAMKGSGLRKNISVRKISANVAVEKIFPLHSPFIKKIVLVSKGKVRRAKLYYLRNRFGKSAQVKKLKFQGK